MKINIIRQVWRSIHLCLLFLFHPSSQTPPSFCSHPAAGFVLEGLCHRFHLGFSPSQKLKSAKKNKPSAAQHPSVVDQYLANEVSLGRVAGPFSAPPFPNLHVSSFGENPKRGQPGKWRLIVDLSCPCGASINNGIDPYEFTLHYITLDQVIRLVSWPNLMWRLIATCPYTRPIMTFWG